MGWTAAHFFLFVETALCLLFRPKQGLSRFE